LGQLDNMCNISLFSTRGLRPSSRMKRYENYRDPILTCLQELLQGCLQPNIRQKASTVQGNMQVDQTYLRTLVVPLVYYSTHDGIKQSSLHVLITYSKQRENQTEDYIKEASTGSELQLHTSSSTVCSHRSSRRTSTYHNGSRRP
jgi:hypothetical protein